MIRTLTVAALALVPAAAAAEAVLQIDYQSRDDYESFRVANVASCAPVVVSEIRINLETAANAVVFDTAPGEPGAENPEGQSLEYPRGRGFVTAVDLPEEGGTTILFTLADFTQGASFEVGSGSSRRRRSKRPAGRTTSRCATWKGPPCRR